MGVADPADGPVRQATAPTGLTEAEVAERVRAGLVNDVDERTSRTLGEIVRANVLTRFNAILAALAVAVFATGRWADAAFAVVLVLNAVIGIGQELRAKRTLDRLALLNAPTARVVRDGEAREVSLAEVVLDDLVELTTGDQVPADGEVVEGSGLEVDESNLTGESDPVPKAPGDRVLSGTIVVAGRGRFQAHEVGADSYARRIAAEVKVFHRAQSEIEQSINALLRYITWVIVVVTPILLWSQFRTSEGDDWRDPVTGTVAALVGMIPEGLVLLTSLAFLLAALALTRRQVLVQELPAVEGLARVDVVCLDKTGTLTVGDIVFDDLEAVGPLDEAELAAGIGDDLPGQRQPEPAGQAVGGVVFAQSPEGLEQFALPRGRDPRAAILRQQLPVTRRRGAHHQFQFAAGLRVFHRVADQVLGDLAQHQRFDRDPAAALRRQHREAHAAGFELQFIALQQPVRGFAQAGRLRGRIARRRVQRAGLAFQVAADVVHGIPRALADHLQVARHAFRPAVRLAQHVAGEQHAAQRVLEVVRDQVHQFLAFARDPFEAVARLFQADVRTHPCQQFLRHERFRHVVHRAGVEAVRATVDTCARLGIEALTLYAFSVENWKRPPFEIEALMTFLKEYLRKELDNIHRENIRFQTIGRTDELDESVQFELCAATRKTAHNTGMTLNVALNYGGRVELVDACRQLLTDCVRDGRDPQTITEAMLEQYLYTADLPDPDLLVRTSGEMRVSNFLLWQIAYSEIYVTNVLWPDFRRPDLFAAVVDYQKRERRYGGLITEPQRAVVNAS